MTQTLEDINTSHNIISHDYVDLPGNTHTDAEITEKLLFSEKIDDSLLQQIEYINDSGVRLATAEQLQAHATLSDKQKSYISEVTFATAVEATAEALEVDEFKVAPNIHDLTLLVDAFDAVRGCDIDKSFRDIDKISVSDIEKIDHIPNDPEDRQEFIASALKTVTIIAAKYEDEIIDNHPLTTPFGEEIVVENIFDNVRMALMSSITKHTPLKSELRDMRAASAIEEEKRLLRNCEEQVLLNTRALESAKQTLKELQSAFAPTEHVVCASLEVLRAESALSHAKDTRASIMITQEIKLDQTKTAA